jgi:Sel1 repeat
MFDIALLVKGEGPLMSKPNQTARMLSLLATCLLITPSAPALAGPDDDNMDVAQTAYLEGEYDAAFEIWQPLADKGNVRAQFELAHALDNCDCVSNGADLAVKYYSMASAKGDNAATFALAEMYDMRKRDKPEAAKYYKQAADRGHAESQIALGDLYQRGIGGAATLAQAPEYYLLAAAQGDKAGYSRLGYLYDNGKIVPRDPVRAYVAYAVAGKLFFPMAKEDAVKAKAKLTAKQVVKGDAFIAKCEKAKFLKCL